MNKKQILTVFLCCIFNAANCQIHINIGVDTSSLKIKKAINFMEKYLYDFMDDNNVDFSRYFRTLDFENYENPDKIAYSLIGNSPIYTLGKPTLLSAQQNNDTVHLKLQFSKLDTSGNITTYFISNHSILFERMQPYFLVNHEINTLKWKHANFRNVTFHYPSYHLLDTVRANNLITQIKKLEKDWSISPEIIQYYFARTRAEIQTIRGFDYNFYMGGNEVPFGLADVKDNLIFTSGLAENHFHEVVHIYLNKVYPESILKEGIAVYLGGSLGNDLKWHLTKLKEFINRNPNVDISDAKIFYYLDDKTNPQYTIQGLLCHLAYNIGGMKGLKRLMEYNSMSLIYSDYFNVVQGQENEFLRKNINEYIP